MNKTGFPLDRRALLAGASALAAGVGAPLKAQDRGSPDLSGRSILITGTSSGFGRLCALYFARLGARVIASMRRLEGGERTEARELAAIAERESLDLHLVEIDVLSDEQVAAGVAQAEAIAQGPLDVVVNNAGIGLFSPVEVMDLEAARLIFDTNMFGYLRVARAALPAMRNAGAGYVVNVTSQLGRIVLPGLGHYCATKFAAEAAFESLAYELAPFGVDVTIVQPGGYPTRIWDNGERYTNDMLARADAPRKAAYEGHLAIAQAMFAGQSDNRSTDPIDVPVAIADLIAMAPGARPLRRPVHPRTARLDAANAALARVQSQTLSGGPFKSWHARYAG